MPGPRPRTVMSSATGTATQTAAQHAANSRAAVATRPRSSSQRLKALIGIPFGDGTAYPSNDGPAGRHGRSTAILARHPTAVKGPGVGFPAPEKDPFGV